MEEVSRVCVPPLPITVSPRAEVNNRRGVSTTRTLALGGFTLSLRNFDLPDIPRPYRPFLRPKPSLRPDMAITLRRQSIPAAAGRPVFTAETYRVDALADGWRFAFHPDPVSRQPTRTVIVDRRFRRAVLFRDPSAVAANRNEDPFLHPMLEVLMLPFFAQRRAFLCHACAVARGGEGSVFLGFSGDGKSTMANLWAKDAVILNDDRCIIRKHNGEFRAYGSPWHGDRDLVSAGGVPLRNIFFLKKGKKNHAVRKGGGKAAAMLLARSFLPLWNRSVLRAIVDLCHRLATTVPCHELTFTPDQSVVKFIMKEYPAAPGRSGKKPYLRTSNRSDALVRPPSAVRMATVYR